MSRSRIWKPRFRPSCSGATICPMKPPFSLARVSLLTASTVVGRAPIPDFYIGAHAAIDGYRLLTRDTARYRTYFPTVSIIAPN